MSLTVPFPRDPPQKKKADGPTDPIQPAKRAKSDIHLPEEAMGGGGGRGEEAAAVLQKRVDEQGERVREMKKSGADKVRREGGRERETEGGRERGREKKSGREVRM